MTYGSYVPQREKVVKGFGVTIHPTETRKETEEAYTVQDEFAQDLTVKTLVNNACTYTTTAKVKTVTNEADIVAAIHWANDSGASVRGMGSLFSWPHIVEPGDRGGNFKGGVVLDMAKYNSMEVVEPLQQPEADGTVALVRVQAGMKVWQLCEILDGMGYALPTLGNVTGQSVGGVISTGTHGKNIDFGTLSSLVQSMRLVLANGENKEIAIKGNDEDPPACAVGVSMGLLGVISTVTLRVVPKHRLAYTVHAISFQQFLDSYVTLLKQNEHVAVVYFPLTDCCRVELSRRLSPEEEENPTKTMPAHTRTKLFFFHLVNWFLFESLFGALFWPVSWLAQIVAVFTDGHLQGVAPGSPALDTSYKVVAQNVSFDIEHHEMEFAYDKADARSVLCAYRETFRSFPIHYQMTAYLDCRFTAGDTAWLAGSHGHDDGTLWLDIIRPTVHSNHEEFMEAFMPVITKYGGRPHFGKESVLTPEETRKAFPMFEAFVQLREQLDPERIFANPHFDSIFASSQIHACNA